MSGGSLKPEFTEVHAYAVKQVSHAIRKLARHLPSEIQEEIHQEAMIRVWNAYQALEADRGWRSFIQTHCRGAVLDYLKAGHASDQDGAVPVGTFDGLQVRVDVQNDDGSFMHVEEICGILGVHTNAESDDNAFEPNWPLLSRMIGRDENLHVVAKIILGFSQEEIAQQWQSNLGTTLSRERISQRIYEFFERLDSPMGFNDPWIAQCIFALGLAKRFHMREHDNGLGWDLHSFDLQDPESFKHVRRFYRPTLFDFLESDAAPHSRPPGGPLAV